MSKLFVVAIGGTGMRCLESFVHLCAIGMFDNKDIDILTLDTDQSNGNKGRVEQLIELYNNVKKDGAVDGVANAGTFFSARLTLYKFFTDYSSQERKNYGLLSVPVAGLPNADQIKEEDRDLSDLFLDPAVQEFNLEHGYRAQTHLGSLLMYNGIIEAMRNAVNNKDKALPQEKALAQFVSNIANEGPTKVFVFGSIFGGTGASSIPIIPKALKDAASLDGNNTLDLNVVKFGSTLLTQYFSFPQPDKSQKAKEKIIASSDNFAINSQAALQFYQSDPTVKMYYKRFYHIGWPSSQTLKIENEGATITGGADQKNACHVVELLCACAAYNFFSLDYDDLQNEKTIYLHRSIEDKEGIFAFTGKDFIDGDDGDVLANKLGIFLSFSHIVLSLNRAATRGELGTKAFISRLNKQRIADYNSLTDAQTKEIDEYLKKFAYNISVKNHALEPGWIYQIYSSIGAGSFIFKNKAFEANTKVLESIDPGDLFADKKFHWDHGFFSNSYDYLVELLTRSDTKPNEQEQHVHTTKEKFLAHIYNGIAIAQKYNAK